MKRQVHWRPEISRTPEPNTCTRRKRGTRAAARRLAKQEQPRLRRLFREPCVPRRRLQLIMLAITMFVSPSITQPAPSAATSDTETSQLESLKVTVTSAERIKSNQVEMHITLENQTNSDLYLPTFGTVERLEIQTLRLLHWEGDRGWLPLGPFSDLPPDTALRLGRGEVYTLVYKLNDPAASPSAGEGIPVHKWESIPLVGKHKIRVGFYMSKEEWQAYRKYVESFSRKAARKRSPSPPPKMTLADSQEFDIPATKSH